MMTFTFILDWDGGTFISQKSALSLNEGVKLWCNSLKESDDLCKLYESILSQLQNEEPVALEGCLNVWCCCFEVDEQEEGLALLNIVQTSID